MRTFIAIILIVIGAYFVFISGKNIYNVNQATDSIESVGNGEYQEVVSYEDVTVYNCKQTYTFLTIGAVFIIGGILLIYLKKKKQA